MNKSRKIKIFVIVLVLIFLTCVSFWLGTLVEKQRAHKTTTKAINTIKPIRENNFNYKYIFPLLAYDFTQVNPYFRDEDLNNKLNTLVKDQIDSKDAESVSVYVRNFTDNHWAGVNEDNQYHPGSMLKVLIMMAYFRQSQLDPSVLDKKMTYSADIDAEANFEFSLPTKLHVGQIYSVTDLINDMIAESDNGAQMLLINNVDRNILNNAYQDLSIPNPDETEGEYAISPRQYVSFLRILYNSTYLTETSSEQALSIMAHSTYKEGLVAGVPSNIEVVHKYGERVKGSNNNIEEVELHDCGIVYAPEHPYSICVMTKGKNASQLAEVIKEVSSLVYNDIISTK